MGLLYEAESKTSGAAAVVAALPLPPASFAAALAQGVESEQAELDALIVKYLRGWTIGRMPAVDRIVLRMGVYELVSRPDVPAAVAISEAVELAKRFSTEESGRFVNGVLAAIAGEVRPGEVRPAPPPKAAPILPGGSPPPGAVREDDDPADVAAADVDEDDWFTFSDDDDLDEDFEEDEDFDDLDVEFADDEPTDTADLGEEPNGRPAAT